MTESKTPAPRCPECTGLVSAEAVSCPHCGYPIARLAGTEPQPVSTEEPTTQRESDEESAESRAPAVEAAGNRDRIHASAEDDKALDSEPDDRNARLQQACVLTESGETARARECIAELVTGESRIIETILSEDKLEPLHGFARELCRERDASAMGTTIPSTVEARTEQTVQSSRSENRQETGSLWKRSPAQAVVIVVFIIVMLIMTLVPPWRMKSRLMYMPPWGKITTSSRVQLDSGRLALQYIAVVLVTGGVIFVLREANAIKREEESEGE